MKSWVAWLLQKTRDGLWNLLGLCLIVGVLLLPYLLYEWTRQIPVLTLAGIAVGVFAIALVAVALMYAIVAFARGANIRDAVLDGAGQWGFVLSLVSFYVLPGLVVLVLLVASPFVWLYEVVSSRLRHRRAKPPAEPGQRS